MAFLMKFFGALLVVVVVLILGIFWYGYKYISAYAKGFEDIELRLDGGTVYVGDPDWRLATANMPLKPGQSVRTGDGSATLVFFGATLLRLDANTEINLVTVDGDRAKIVIKTENGRTWHRVIRAAGKTITDDANLMGVSEYEVQLPTAVATVRGTVFSTDAKGSVSVVEGRVGVNADGRQVMVENATAVIDKAVILKPLNDRDPWILKNRQKDSMFDAELAARMREKYRYLVQKVKELLGDRYQKLAEMARRRFGLTPEQVDQEVEKAIRLVLGT